MSVNLSENLEPLKVWNIRTWYFISVGRTCSILENEGSAFIGTTNVGLSLSIWVGSPCQAMILSK